MTALMSAINSYEMGLAIRRQCGEGRVYAIEREPGALELIDANRRKFHGDWFGFHIVAGEAPEALRGLETPTHAFIGGSGGRMKEMIEVLLQMNPKVRIVANAISLETVTEILGCMKSTALKKERFFRFRHLQWSRWEATICQKLRILCILR